MTTTETESQETAEQAEEAHLADIHARLRRALQANEARLQRYARELQEQKRYLWESRADMDHVEKVSSRESIEQQALTSEALEAQQQRLLKIRKSPYFGRCDFARQGETEPRPVYIGIHHFHDEEAGRTRIHDWRAPISSLFYDYETGPARYEAPEGEVDGSIALKRQFRINGTAMEMMFDTAVNVVDDVLQAELSRSSDDGMKNIVATIQREQNAIIRNHDAPVLVIQGVAGSGKTSIALHRIAFLLYRFKDTLSSDNILILSPNRVFADYIANVLPELGEESVDEVGMDTLAETLLEGQYRFQTFFEQTATLLEKEDEALQRRIQVKAEPEFLKRLDEYIAEVEKQRFAAEDLWIARRLVPGWLLEETFRRHRRLGTRDRIRQVADEIEKKIGLEYNYDLEPAERRELREAVKGMVQQSTLRQTYQGFFDWLGEPELFKPAKGGRLEYSDVFPLIDLKQRLEGIKSPWDHVKHLIVDEMQDYTPVQYAVLNRLFPCNKTILGDAHQTINPHGSSTAESIRGIIPQARVATLNTSYRSSYEITEFARQIIPNPDLVAMRRHGEAPEVHACRSRQAELDRIRAELDAFAASEHTALAVIARSQKQANRLHAALVESGYSATLLEAGSQQFSTGVVVCTATLAKGLEFDRVVVPEVSEKTYRTAMDRHLLYVACTRAMHRLALTHSGTPSPFLPATDFIMDNTP